MAGDAATEKLHIAKRNIIFSSSVMGLFYFKCVFILNVGLTWIKI